MQIVFFETEGWESPLLQELKAVADVVLTPDKLGPDNARDYQNADIVSPFVHSRLDRTVLEQLPNLKYIATRSTGYDHIDLNYCAEASIAVSNVPVYGTNTVAEHAFALLLALAHHIPEATVRTRQGDFSTIGLRGFDLHGKTLGVVGTGNIGKRVAEIGRGFAMQILAFDIEPDADFAKQNQVSYVTMNELLAQSDCITLHVPGGDATRHMLADAEFAKMKQGAVVINTARGTVIDTQSLLRALADGTVAAAGLDVLPEDAAMKDQTLARKLIAEPDSHSATLQANQALLLLDNVIVTPHSAFNTVEAVQRILQTTQQNITAFIEGRHQNPVTAQ